MKKTGEGKADALADGAEVEAKSDGAIVGRIDGRRLGTEIRIKDGTMLG